MNKSKFFSMVAVTVMTLLAATSCNKADEPDVNGAQVELRLSSGIEAQTRAPFTGADTQIPAGQSVIVYVDDANTSADTVIYENNFLTADGSGNLTGRAMYFPKSVNTVNVYAIHINNNTLTGAYPTTAITHTVAIDQADISNYAPSDLLYAKATSVSKTSSAVPLTFYHLLSKLQVAVVAGDGLTDSDITGITIGGTKIEAEFTLNKSTASNAIAVTANGTATDIKIDDDVSTNFSSISYNDAIIVPQTVAANTTFITVHTSTNGDLVYKLPGSGATFESGKKYTYHITAQLAGLTMTSSITDWTPPANPVTGTAED
ncbi:MAG: fimbrillin family protein [Tannerellaceae bacterium]|jgi:hypothetical protein|nr:fimbrillin family protein [Tannerellaceae bacterium]